MTVDWRFHSDSAEMLPQERRQPIHLIHRIAELFTDSVDNLAICGSSRMGRTHTYVRVRRGGSGASQDSGRRVFTQRRGRVGEGT